MMRLRFAGVVVGLALLAAGAAFAGGGAFPVRGDDADAGAEPIPAAWLPGRTLFCVESADMRRLGEELSKLCAASPLGDFPRKLKTQVNAVPFWLREAALMLTPDGLPELQKCGGVAFAMFADAKGSAQGVWVLRTGAATGVQLALRKQLADGSWKEHKEIAGVPVYYRWGQGQVIQGADAEGMPREKLVGVDLLALLPGGAVYGAPDAVTEIIHRAKGQGVGPALAADARYQELRQRTPPQAAMVYADASKLAEAGLLPSGGLDLDGLRQLTCYLRLERNRVSGRGQLACAPGKVGALANATPAGKATPGPLAFLPKGAAAFLVWSSDGADAGPRAVQAFEALAKALGADELAPMGLLRKAAAKRNLNLASDFASRLRQAGIAVTLRGRSLEPVVVLEAKDEAAKGWLWGTGMPTLAQAASGADQAPAWAGADPEHTLDLGGGMQLYAMTQGMNIVIAWDRSALSQALLAVPGGHALSGVSSVAGLFQEGQDPGMVIGIRPGTFPAQGFAKPAAGQPAASAPPPPGAAGGAAMSVPPGPLGTGAPPKPLLGAWASLFDAGDWVAVGLRRQGDQIEMQFSSYDLTPRLTALVEALSNVDPSAAGVGASAPGGLGAGGVLQVVPGPGGKMIAPPASARVVPVGGPLPEDKPAPTKPAPTKPADKPGQ